MNSKIPTLKHVALIVFGTSLVLAQDPVLSKVEARAARFGEISRQIWDLAELGFKESRSAALLRDELRRSGFRIEDGVAGMPTAFTASWGEGQPVIAILGEYDALPGLSQDTVAEPKPIAAGGSGHGCGHNLFGSASALAAIAVKEELEARKLKGAIRFYGTPAEEGGGGKIFMIRAGLFRDVDIALVWHPWDANEADNQSWLANTMAKVGYFGRAAHAAAAPDKGRSALDGLEITTHAINLLREHVPQETRMHYAITRGGGAANIVPGMAELSLIIRHPQLSMLESITERVMNCAQAGALGSGTRMEWNVQGAYANYLPNRTLVQVLDAALRQSGGVQYTPAERAFASQIRGTLEGDLPPIEQVEQIGPPRTRLLSGSTDVGDVSWVVPTGQFLAATWVAGVPPHTWQSTACSGSSIGRKGMLVAARTLALAAVRLFDHPEQVEAAKAAFVEARAGRQYRSLLPARAKPAIE